MLTRLLLLSAALLCIPRLSMSGDIEALKARLPSEWIKVMRQLDSAEEHRKFIEYDAKKLVLVPSGTHGLSDSALGAFIDGVLYLNEEDLLKGARELEALGMSGDELVRTVAWKSVSKAVHEIRHAITTQEVEDLIGYDVGGPFFENEVVCFFDEIKLIHEIMRKKPGVFEENVVSDYDRHTGVLLQAWQADKDGIERMTELSYKGKIWLRATPREKLLAERRQLAADMRKGLKATDSLKAALPEITDPKRRAQVQDSIDNGGTFKETLKQAQAEAGVFADPEKFARLRGYYAARLRAMHRLWDKQTGGSSR